MIELRFHVDHAQGQRSFAHFSIVVDKDVIIRPILLKIIVSDCAWNVRVAGTHGKGLGNLRAKLAVPL